MEILSTEGVVAHALPFQEYDRILTVFTPGNGLIKLFVKGAFSQKKGQGSSTAPLTQIEATCTKGRSELYNCRELDVLNSHLKLRQNLATLDAACDMLQTVLATQMPGKASPDLYQLFLAYLTRLPEASNPLAISTSFRLKTLRHEGLLALSTHLDPTLFDSERQLMEYLAFCRDFQLLASLPVDDILAGKIKNLFQQSLEH